MRFLSILMAAVLLASPAVAEWKTRPHGTRLAEGPTAYGTANRGFYQALFVTCTANGLRVYMLGTTDAEELVTTRDLFLFVDGRKFQVPIREGKNGQIRVGKPPRGLLHRLKQGVRAVAYPNQPYRTEFSLRGSRDAINAVQRACRNRPAPPRRTPAPSAAKPPTAMPQPAPAQPPLPVPAAPQQTPATPDAATASQAETGPATSRQAIEARIRQACDGPFTLANEALVETAFDTDETPDFLLDWGGVSCADPSIARGAGNCGAAYCAIDVHVSSAEAPQSVLGVGFTLLPLGTGQWALQTRSIAPNCPGGAETCTVTWQWTG